MLECLAAEVDEGSWLDEVDLSALVLDEADHCIPFDLSFVGVILIEVVNYFKSNIVASTVIFCTDIADSENEIFHSWVYILIERG